MTWLTNLCSKWPRICPVCRFLNHNQVLSLFITYHRVCNKINSSGCPRIPPPAATDEFARFKTCLSGVHVVNGDTCIYVFMFLFPCCDVRYDFRLNTMLDSCVLTPIWCVGGSRFNYVNCIYLRMQMSNTIPYHMMFVSFNSNTTGATCGEGTTNPCEAHEFTSAFSGVRASRFSVFCM